MNQPYLPADVIGHMAGLGGTNEPFIACYSCQRALIYTALLHAGAVGAALEEGDSEEAMGCALNVVQLLLEFAKLDFAATVDTNGWSEDDRMIGLMSFYRSRCEHFTDEEGGVVFEPHDDEGGRWDLEPVLR